MNNLRYRKAFRWPGQVEAFIRSRANGFVINVCNGESMLGDLRIDRFSDNTDIRADAGYLPLKGDIADTVICDPPWELPYHLRGRLVKELRRILKPGGILLFEAPWSPKQPGLPVEEILVPEYQLMWFRNIALLWVCRKTRGLLPGFQYPLPGETED